MKRYIRVISLIIILVGLFIYFKNKPVNYEIDYSLNDYKVYEKYNKNDKYYSFKLVKDEYVFYFAKDIAYTPKRKLINSLNEEVNDSTICVSISTKDSSSEFICSNTKEYTTYNLFDNDVLPETLDTYEDIKIYNKDYKYYEWNGYGFTDILKKKEYKILKKESYNNSLSYKYGDYIIFADYDEKNEFNKFYLFNTKKNKFETIKLKDSISFDSYFQGVYKNKIYLFDRNNSIQYSINLKKKNVLKSSDKEGGLYFDGKVSTKSLNTLKYNNILFKENNYINYYLEDKTLYYSYIDSDIKIKLRDNVDVILKTDDTTVIYLTKGVVKELNLKEESKSIIESMQWEFHYDSQIYIF